MEARAEGVPPATSNCYSSGLRVGVTPRAGLLQAFRPSNTGAPLLATSHLCSAVQVITIFVAIVCLGAQEHRSTRTFVLV